MSTPQIFGFYVVQFNSWTLKYTEEDVKQFIQLNYVNMSTFPYRPFKSKLFSGIWWPTDTLEAQKGDYTAFKIAPHFIPRLAGVYTMDEILSFIFQNVCSLHEELIPEETVKIV